MTEWLPRNVVDLTPTKVNFTAERYHKCTVYVHQAKIQPRANAVHLSDPKLVIVTNGKLEATKVCADLPEEQFSVMTWLLGRDSITVCHMERSSRP